MKAQPVIIERVLDAPVTKVWKAITDRDEMSHWYFQLDEFKPEVGFKFQFYGGKDDKQYLHLCEVTEVVAGKKIAYSWRYDGFPGYSVVTFELQPQGDKTLFKVTHEGLESFADAGPDFVKENFVLGWTSIVGDSLAKYMQTHKG